ncbi:beta-1,3-galactosyltransferase 5-like isoform X2 [Pieris brassicae]|uniref:beta-1,3-galactosyltransferase 5-like isoform X2 n=1 Tax=Pieris brassicae TaxID=7116 RepID=UPI001E65F199|nr:beta-1,3-galactosyltransferase 5-like isoform X2 [Pieris brassicae]
MLSEMCFKLKMRRFNWISRLVPRRNSPYALFLLFVICVPLMWCWLMIDTVSSVILTTVAEEDLYHLQRNRNLKEYIDNIPVLIEPSKAPCGDILVLVTSSPGRFEARDAIRSTWGKHLVTLFVMGLDGYTEDDLMVDNYLEAKLHSDIIIYNFKDHYQNLTIKTGLMLEWTISRCSTSKFLFKTDDDVLVNPWKLRQIVEKNTENVLIGYRKSNTYLHRDTYSKWHIPRWLLQDDFVPHYLSGTGYLINGNLGVTLIRGQAVNKYHDRYIESTCRTTLSTDIDFNIVSSQKTILGVIMFRNNGR